MSKVATGYAVAQAGFRSENLSQLSMARKKLEASALEALNKAETLVVNDILGNAAELVNLLSRSYSPSDTDQQTMSSFADIGGPENPDSSEQRRKNFDIHLGKLTDVGDKYLEALEKVTNTVLQHIPMLSPFVEIHRTNYGLKKDIELLDEKLLLIQDYINQSQP